MTSREFCMSGGTCIRVLDKKTQLSRSKTKIYKTIRVSWRWSEEVCLLKSSVRGIPVEVLKYLCDH